MRTWNLLSGVGVAILAAWLGVTNLAQAAEEFTCTIGWHGDTACGLPKITLQNGESLKIEVDSIQHEGKDVGGPAEFAVRDVKKDAVVTMFMVHARTSATWKYEGKESPLEAQLRVNHHAVKTVVVRGRYTILR